MCADGAEEEEKVKEQGPIARNKQGVRECCVPASRRAGRRLHLGLTTTPISANVSAQLARGMN
jgi:hypothetical protein